MDEPFAALDEQTRNSMGEELLQIWEELRTTVVFITHSLSEALFLSDRVVAMGRGKIADDFRVDFPRPRDLDLMNQPEFVGLRHRLFEALDHS